MYLVMAYLKFEFEYKSPAIPMKRQTTGNYKINFFTRHNSHAAVPGVKLCEIIIRQRISNSKCDFLERFNFSAAVLMT